MSVPKSRRGESPAEYINLAREIYVFTYNRVRILPKSYTFYFSLPLYNAAREAYRMIKTANLIYVDEKSPEEIRRRNIQRLCDELGIRLNPKKTQIIKLTRGFTFVKVRFRYGANGKVVRRATYKGIRHMREKLRIFRRWADSGRMTAADVETSLVSWRGHMRRFHSYHMAQTVERRYRELFKGG